MSACCEGGAEAVLGLCGSGLVRWRPRRDGHLVVVAGTGYGKTSVLNLIAGQVGATGASPVALSVTLDQACAAVDAAGSGGVAVLDEVQVSADQVAALLAYADERDVAVVMSCHPDARAAGAVARFSSRLSLGPLSPAQSLLVWGDSIGRDSRVQGQGVYASAGVPQPTPVAITQDPCQPL